MSTKKISVLYLDDEVENLNSFNANFRRLFNVSLANSIDEAYSIIESKEIHVVSCIWRTSWQPWPSIH